MDIESPIVQNDSNSFSLYYRKNNNSSLFTSLENSSFKLSKLQNYIPIYNVFFNFIFNNFNSINLNSRFFIKSLLSVHDDNSMTGTVTDSQTNTDNIEKNIFLKFSPLIEPVKYLSGKFENSQISYLNTPSFNNLWGDSDHKSCDPFNSSYVDGFFSYLSSQMLHKHDIIHGLDFYGLFIGKQEKFKVNIIDDIEYLEKTPFFNKNKNILFDIDDSWFTEKHKNDTRENKSRLFINSDNDITELQFDNLDTDYENVFIQTNDDLPIHNLTIHELDGINNELDDFIQETECIFENKEIHIEDKCSTSSCSSRSSYTTEDESENDDDCKMEIDEVPDYVKKDEEDLQNTISEVMDEDNEDEDEDDYEDEEDLFAYLHNFPVSVIMLEKCDNTLDSLMMDEELEMSDDEWKSALMQVVMTLLIYQKMFHFTHNDLHTNNIMFIKTEKQFIYYYYNKKYYRVPTYGKIFKIIDFGRAIYKFKGKIICSDSFGPNGDATTQYNCEPYFNENKPRLDPNYSFDLCRLGCSLFDYFIEDLRDIKKMCKESDLIKLVVEWVTDDNDRNILYKMNGEERYPDFKLYKMIARNVHNHTPQNQLKKKIFADFEIPKKKIKKEHKIMNIDELPSYVD